MTETPVLTLHASNLLQKVIPPFALSCHLTWEAARDNGSAVTQYRVEFKSREDGYVKEKEWIAESTRLQRDVVDCVEGNRCSVVVDDHDAEGWIEEMREDTVRVLLDGAKGYSWFPRASVTPCAFPKQQDVGVGSENHA